MSDQELEELKGEFPRDWENRVERLSEYMASTGKRYASPLAAIRYWSRKEKPNGNPSPSDGNYGWQFGTVL